MNRRVQARLWQRLDQPSLETCFITEDDTGVILNGTVTLELDGEPAVTTYRLELDGAWRTKSVRVELARSSGTNTLELRIDEGRWWQEERELTHLRGLTDIDLSVTPATNTLPVRRTGLSVGESAEVTTAWLRFPNLDLEPLRQRYTRLDEKTYRYDSGPDLTSFSADLCLDEEGFVLSYRSSDLGWVGKSGPDG